VLTGCGTGIAGVVVPTYVGETSPGPYRGVLRALFNLGITIGVLGIGTLAYVGLEWRQLAYLHGALPQAVLLLCLMPETVFPESPEHVAKLVSALATCNRAISFHPSPLDISMSFLYCISFSLC